MSMETEVLFLGLGSSPYKTISVVFKIHRLNYMQLPVFRPKMVEYW